MEDAHAAVLDLQVEDAEVEFKAAESDVRLSFFGVYDGHGGDKVALYAGENMHKIIAKQEAFKAGDFEQALKDGFLATDRAILDGTPCQLSLSFDGLMVLQTPNTKKKCPAAPLPLA